MAAAPNVTESPTGSPTPVEFNQTPINVSSLFWGTTINVRYSMVSNEEEMIASSPARVLVWPGGNAGDDYDLLNNTIVTVAGGKAVFSPENSSNLTQFHTLCVELSCTPIFQVTGEYDSPTIAYDEVQDIAAVWGSLNGTYWEVGNEPTLWKHWPYAWNEWGEFDSDGDRPSAQAYAEEVEAYIPYMREAAPGQNLLFIGIPATGTSSSINGEPQGSALYQWIYNTTYYNGPNLAAVAFHEYPAAGQKLGKSGYVAPTLAGFYAALNGADNISTRMAISDEAIQAAEAASKCTDCHISVFLTELGSALSQRPYGMAFSPGFAGALSMGVQIIQSIDSGVANQDLYSSFSPSNNSWENTTGNIRPEYELYADLLPHLGNVAYGASLGPTNGTGYAIGTVDTNDGDRVDLMVINTGIEASQSLAFAPRLPNVAGVDYADAPVEVWTWSGTVTNASSSNANVTPATPAPTARLFESGLPASWTLPPQSIAVFEAFPRTSNATQVSFTEKGLPPTYSTFWFLNVSGRTYATNGSSFDAFLPTSNATLLGPGIPVPFGTDAARARERLFPAPSSPLTVAGVPINVSVPFVDQWRVTANATPAGDGSVDPGAAWATAAEPATITPRPSPGYAFTYWSGFGSDQLVFPNSTSNTGGEGKNGSYVGPDYVATVDPTGWITEVAHFARGYPILFEESGLPEGTPWSVDLRSSFDENGTIETGTYLVSSVTDVAVLEASNGTYGFTLGTVPGYQVGVNGTEHYDFSVSVSGRPATVQVVYRLLTPHKTEYEVAFEEVGLPAGTKWSVAAGEDVSTVIGNSTNVTRESITLSTTTSSIIFLEADGSYGYHASSIPGYRARPASEGYRVNGSSIVIPVVFGPVLYDVVWMEAGLESNLSWTVGLSDGLSNVSHGAWTTLKVPNGTYSFQVDPVAGYRAEGAIAGTFVVNNSSLRFSLDFYRSTYEIRFTVTSSSSILGTWVVRLANASITSSTSAATFSEPNGSYTYDIQAPAGFVASPSHGSVLIDAAPKLVMLSFDSTAPTVTPIWVLAEPALVVAGVLALSGGLSFGLIRRARRRSTEEGR